MVFYDPSEKALQPEKSEGYRYKEQFENVPIGKVFIVPMSEIGLGSIRPLASNVGKKLKKRFKVVVHDDKRVFEVVRLDDPVESQPVVLNDATKAPWDDVNKVNSNE